MTLSRISIPASFRQLRILTRLLLCMAVTISLGACSGHLPSKHIGAGSPDDGSQMDSPFRLNYLGYLPLQEKLAVYITEENKAIAWSIKDRDGQVQATGVSNERRTKDHASGDTFYIIDFSSFKQVGNDYTLSVDGQASAPFDINDNPYGNLKYEFFDYFKDHRRSGDVFSRHVDSWTDHVVSFDFVADAGDQGYYTVNAAEAQWHLINSLEAYPEMNEYYHAHSKDMATVYDELVYMSDPLGKLIFPGETLAVAKLHTYSNSTDAHCLGAKGKGRSCISKPETKATYAVARTLAAMARLHKQYGSEAKSHNDFIYAKQALKNAEQTPFVCLSWKAFGGEGGYYPNNDNWSLWRNPRRDRDPCAEGTKADPKNDNVQDDQYSAMVEVYLAAMQLGYSEDAEALKQKIELHPHHLRVDKFFWGAVATEGTLSLLTHRPDGLDLSQAEKNIFIYADKVLNYQSVGYPGVTFDTQSDEWDAGDEEDKDNNFRWGSNRMQLNDARILMMAAQLKYTDRQYKAAAKYTNAVLRVMDQISGTNAVALAMYTAGRYDKLEHAVTRTHDKLVPDTVAGKLVVGPNNWTNASDRDMPKFGSQPGMKSFALKGTGWSSREVFIDGNAPLVAVSYFATEIAPAYLAAAAN